MKRDPQDDLADRLASLQDGRAIVIEGDEQLGRFLDAIDAEVDAERWDRQIEADVAAGELDALAGEAIREHRAG
jgi:hypothetical protein